MNRQDRREIAEFLADKRGGVVRRAELLLNGITREHVRTEIRAGVWARGGRHTVVINGRTPTGDGLLWRAVWESGAGALLDGASALIAHGLENYTTDVIDVSMPARNRHHRVPDVRLHRPNALVAATNLRLPPCVPIATAVINAARWADSKRQAALVIALPVQQRLVKGEALVEEWAEFGRCNRRDTIHETIAAVAAGAQSLGELDFGRLCRKYGLPRPTRQELRRTSQGTAYLDVFFKDAQLAVEIDGGHHLVGLNPVDDALRQNAVTLGSDTVLRIPLLGLRIAEKEFMGQVVAAYRQGLTRAAKRRPTDG